MRTIYLIAHNLRSAHNVGSLLRTAEGLGVKRVYLTGYTPYPELSDDNRLPHVIVNTTSKIKKASLGAEEMLDITHWDELEPAVLEAKSEGFVVAALEQAEDSVLLFDYRPPDKICLVVGPEVTGFSSYDLDMCDLIIEIPMFGKKESFNVSNAASMALGYLRFAK